MGSCLKKEEHLVLSIVVLGNLPPLNHPFKAIRQHFLRYMKYSNFSMVKSFEIGVYDLNKTSFCRDCGTG